MAIDLQTLPSGLKEVLRDTEKEHDDGDSSGPGLEVRIYYLECLAQASYVVSHEGNAFIVDPRRDVDAFLEDLQKSNVVLKGVFETHFHADFVSGHCELKDRLGVPVYFGEGTANRCKFQFTELKNKEMVDLSSRYAFQALHTPGHTMESTVYLLVDKTANNKPLKAFTGDTLFIGSCGRPDLVGSIGYTADKMARTMFRTLQSKVLSLPDDVQVFPAHGAGSPCGKSLGSELYSTIGQQRLTNPALKFTNEDEFVKFLTEGQPTAPQYFLHDVDQNLTGPKPLCAELSGVCFVTADAFKEMVDTDNYTLADTRSATEFCRGHVPNSLNFPLGGEGGAIVGPEDGNFAMWVGTLVPPGNDILLVTDMGKEGEALQRLARIGYTKVKAVLRGGFCSYKEAGLPVETATRVDIRASPLSSLLASGMELLDVRTKGEFEQNTAKASLNLPLAEMSQQSLEKCLEKDKVYLVFCSSGYRSAIAASVLKRWGFKGQDIVSGFASVSYHSPELTTSGKVCPVMKALMEKMLAAS